MIKSDLKEVDKEEKLEIVHAKDPRQIFNEFLQKKRIFKNKEVLSSSFVPDTIIHRDKEIEEISNLLAPSLLLERTSNLLIYGFSGTGKSLVTRFVAQNLASMAAEKKVNVVPVYINCRLENNNTEYRLISNLSSVFGIKVPVSGLSINSLYKNLISVIDLKKQNIILILDEIEKLIQNAGDGVLYNLLRINELLSSTKLSIIGISNNTEFKASLDQRVKSSLSPVEIVFKPYNAIEIADILSSRIKDSFFEGVVDEGIIYKCAAIAAQEHGDVRRALNLIKVAGELAQQTGSARITEDILDKASDLLEQNVTEEIIRSMTKQSKCALYAILSLSKSKNFGKIYSGEVYDYYMRLADKFGLKRLTFRRLSELIGELDYNSLIMTRIRNNGRYGRTRELSIAFPSSLLVKVEQILLNELSQ
ncbi:MAG: AAA family ATPase [Candidatus Micrarchaeaceae archaeon]|nr:AAA family ATPase [Candidatus Parvarchaeota archaeon]